MLPRLLSLWLLCLYSAVVVHSISTASKRNTATSLREAFSGIQKSRTAKNVGNEAKDEVREVKNRRFLESVMGDPYQSNGGGGSMDFGSQGWGQSSHDEDSDEDDEYYYYYDEDEEPYYYYDEEEKRSSDNKVKKSSDGKQAAKQKRFLEAVFGDPYQDNGGGGGMEFGSQGWQDESSEEDEYYDEEDCIPSEDDDCEYYYYYYDEEEGDETAKRGIRSKSATGPTDQRRIVSKSHQQEDDWDNPWPRDLNQKIVKKAARSSNKQTGGAQRRFIVDSQRPETRSTRTGNELRRFIVPQAKARSVSEGLSKRRFIVDNQAPQVRSEGPSNPNLRRFMVDRNEDKSRRNTQTQRLANDVAARMTNNEHNRRFVVDPRPNPAANRRALPGQVAHKRKADVPNATKRFIVDNQKVRRFMVDWSPVKKSTLQRNAEIRGSSEEADIIRRTATEEQGETKRFSLKSLLSKVRSLGEKDARSQGKDQRNQRDIDSFLIPTQQ